MQHLEKAVFGSTLISQIQVECLLQETMDHVVSTLNVSSSLAKLLLYFYKWDDSTLIKLYSVDPCKVLVGKFNAISFSCFISRSVIICC